MIITVIKKVADVKVDGKTTTVSNQGIQGLSAYQIAVRNGFVGTEQEWLNSLAVINSNVMEKNVYDTNNSGVVDNSKKVNNLTVETAVPQNAVFTDTVYDDSSTLVNSDIDVKVQSYNEDIVIDSNYTHTDNNFTDALKALLGMSKVKNISMDTDSKLLMITYTDGSTSNLNLNEIVTGNSSTEPNYILITENYTASSRDYVQVDTLTVGSLTITLPASPVQGDYIDILDIKSNFDVNKLIIDRNDNLLMGENNNIEVTTKNIEFRLIYLDNNWRIV